jgi:inhibitor of cysteine peptidase
MVRFTGALLLVAFAVAFVGRASSQDQNASQSARQSAGKTNSGMPVVSLGPADSGRQITIPMGRIVLVRLDANPSTGYSWSVIGNPAPLVFVSSEYEAGKQKQQPPGSPEMQVLRLKSDRAGTGDLKLGYRRPWEKDVAPAKTFQIHVTVPEGPKQ